MFNLSRSSSLLTVAVVCAVVSGLVVAATAQVKQGKTRPLTTSQMMKAMVKPNCEAVKKGLEAAPVNDDAWADLALKLAVLNESSYTLMDDGRCPDSVWTDAVNKFLRPGSAAALKAIEAKDFEATKTAFGTVMQSCKACHEKHKPKKK